MIISETCMIERTSMELKSTWTQKGVFEMMRNLQHQKPEITVQGGSHTSPTHTQWDRYHGPSYQLPREMYSLSLNLCTNTHRYVCLRVCVCVHIYGCMYILQVHAKSGLTFNYGLIISYLINGYKGNLLFTFSTHRDEHQHPLLYLHACLSSFLLYCMSVYISFTLF